MRAEQRVMGSHQLVTSAEAGAIEGDELQVIIKWRRKRLGTAAIPAVHHGDVKRAQRPCVRLALPVSAFVDSHGLSVARPGRADLPWPCRVLSNLAGARTGKTADGRA